MQRSGDPVDDAERDSLTARLNDAFGDGRISHDEYAAAMDTVYGARTLGDLVPVIEKLPAAAANIPAIVTQAARLPATSLPRAIWRPSPSRSGSSASC
ncbi:DUF1707 domain-containing protein [Tessaracoccus sp. HDW20]|uniref:DUF1707 SHOCT-like domain-containing protein n=1 Tax=Tessaracoccus coleopterorum TaxID=2714950 RepID=UPI0018D3E2F8|nr:DUF1707 domain-containing protein [Tessaracoccus coleopterorum]NHB84080.1 DUF1707 domain-containing protein [Tessaracoccus coleopterorum]